MQNMNAIVKMGHCIWLLLLGLLYSMGRYAPEFTVCTTCM